MKLIYCTSSHLSFGGMEIVTAFKASALARIEGNSVWIAETEKTGKMTLPPEVEEIDLGIRYNENPFRFPLNLFVVLQKKYRHRKRLKKTFERIQPDVVISVGDKASFLPSIKGPWKNVFELHFPKYRSRYLESGSNLIIKLSEWWKHDIRSKSFDAVVSLTEEDRLTNWAKNKNVCTISNPCRFRPQTPAALNTKRVMACGRLSYQKNFSSLIRIWSFVAKSHPDWKLDIFGDGEDRSRLMSEIEEAGLSGVIHLKGNASSVEKEMLSSSLFVMTSRYEGQALVLLEAQSCGLPIVSYACPYGPKEVVTNEKTGFLVPPEDEKSFADGICRLIEDDSLRNKMGAAAFLASKQYDHTLIAEKWMTLFRHLLYEE